MRALLIAVALAAVAVAARADDVGGLSGYVRLENGTLLGKATLRYGIAGYPAREITTDRNGFFAGITLEPGRYYIWVLHPPIAWGEFCVSPDVLVGEVTRTIIVIKNTQTTRMGHCLGPAPSLVDPDQTGDLYRIH